MTTIKDLEAKLDNLPQNVWGYRHPKYGNRDAHGLLRDSAESRSTLEKISDQLNVVGRVAAEARELARSVPQRLIGSRVPFIKGTSLHKLFGKDFRLGALLGYGAASMVDRDTHTEKIVDALDTGDLGPSESQAAMDVAVEVDKEES